MGVFSIKIGKKVDFLGFLDPFFDQKWSILDGFLSIFGGFSTVFYRFLVDFLLGLN